MNALNKTYSNASRLGLIAIITLLVCSCSLFRIYRPDIQQGNHLKASEAKQVKVGMSRSQVTAAIGSPVLNNDFNNNTWTYIYTYTPGTISSGNGKYDPNRHPRTNQNKQLIIHFSNDKVSRVQHRDYSDK